MRAGVGRALTIAGSDSGGGAGVQADLKTFAAYGVYGASAITAVTAQNTRGVKASLVLPPQLVVAQIEAVVGALGADAIKTGMLGDAPVAEAVAQTLERIDPVNLIVDPVMMAKGGASLLDEAAIDVVRERLLPLAACVTPNLPEAAALVGHAVQDRGAMWRAGSELMVFGAGAALVKGGHLEGDPVDLLCLPGRVVELPAERIDTRHTHGTGCTLAAAITAGLARGWDLERAVRGARAYLLEAIRQAPGLGHGHGPLWHGVVPPGLEE